MVNLFTKNLEEVTYLLTNEDQTKDSLYEKKSANDMLAK